MRLEDPKKYQGKRERVHWRFFLHLGMGKGRKQYFHAALFITPLSSVFGRAGHSRGQKGSSPPFFVHHVPPDIPGGGRGKSENSCVYVCTVHQDPLGFILSQHAREPNWENAASRIYRTKRGGEINPLPPFLPI